MNTKRAFQCANHATFISVALFTLVLATQTVSAFQETSAPTIPHVSLLDQHGTSLDLVKLIQDKTVAINFVYTGCRTSCSPASAIFSRVRQGLGERMGRDLALISISLDPARDGPDRLKAYAAKFDAGPGWTFVTGESHEIRRLLNALGASSSNTIDHTPMILVGNHSRGTWTRMYGLSSPSSIIETVTAIAGADD